MANRVQANILLSSMPQDIQSLEKTSAEPLERVMIKIGTYRDLLDELCEPGPFQEAIKAYALTLLKVGACSELTMRLAIEYFLRFKTLNLTMVFAFDKKNSHENHCFALIGQPVVDERLILHSSSLRKDQFDRRCCINSCG